MEDEEIKVKNEPLDYEDQMNNEGILATAIPTKKELDDVIIKTEYSGTEVRYQYDNSFKIVNERSDIITVNAVDSKSVDEISFIKQMSEKKTLVTAKKPPQEAKTQCSICYLKFTSSDYSIHMKSKLCKAPKYFYCRKKCGKAFLSVNRCVEHEFLNHSDRSITCSICFNNFPTCDDLLKHMELDGCGRLPKHAEPKEMHEDELRQILQKKNWTKRSSEMPTFPITKTKHRKTENKTLVQQETVAVEGAPIEIKQEPVDDELILPDCMTESDIKEFTEFDIKTEPQDEINEKPLIDFNNMPHGVTITPLVPLQNPNSTFQRIVLPLTAPPQSLKVAPNFILKTIPNGSIVRLPTLKAAPVKIGRNAEMALKQGPPPLQMGGHRTYPINLQGCKILKLAPNSKIIRLPANAKPLPNSDTEPIRIAPIAIGGDSQPLLKEETKRLLVNREITVKNVDGTILNSSKETATPPSLEKLLSDVTKQDLEEFVADATQYAVASNRNLCLPTRFLKAVERLPERRQVVQEMLDQIEAIQLPVHQNPIEKVVLAPKIKVGKSKSVVCQPVASVDCKPPDVPTSFFIRLLDECSETISKKRLDYPAYRFTFKCPHCPRQYEQKHAFLSHLVSLHSMFRDEMEKLHVEVVPLPAAQRFDSLHCAVKSTIPKAKPVILPSIDDSSSSSSPSSVPSTDELSTGKYRCRKCGRVLSTKQVLFDHMLAKCGSDHQYHCGICSKRFFSASTRTCHMTIHTGVLPHKCHYCDKRFRTRGQVTVHHRTHTGERPFICQVCSQRFTHRETLISHLSRHIGMKRYKCYGCNKTFSCISGLQMHRDVRPQTCGTVGLNSRAVGPRIRVVKGNVVFEPQPEINSYLRPPKPQEILSEIQNQPETA